MRFYGDDMKWIVRTNGPSGALEPAMRDAIRAIDPTLAFVRFETMTSVIRRDLDMQRLLTILIGAFATSAMLLAAVGLDGVIAYSAVQRRQEVGVRMALGASSSWVLKAFVGEGLVLAGAGLMVGTAGAVAARQPPAPAPPTHPWHGAEEGCRDSRARPRSGEETAPERTCFRCDGVLRAASEDRRVYCPACRTAYGFPAPTLTGLTPGRPAGALPHHPARREVRSA